MENKTQAPAIALMIAAGLSSLLDLLSLAFNVLGVGLGTVLGSDLPDASALMGGTFGALMAVAGLAIQAFIIYGAIQMKNLENYNLALAAAIVACVPCFTCCCFNVPAGIWALVVLLSGDTKTLFQAA